MMYLATGLVLIYGLIIIAQLGAIEQKQIRIIKRLKKLEKK